MADDRDTDDDQNGGSNRPLPNYAARRMLTSTVAITLIVLSAVWAYRLVGDHDSPDESSWDAIALIDTQTGAATIVDRAGAVVDRFETAPQVSSVYAEGAALTVVTKNELLAVTSLQPTPNSPWRVGIPDGAVVDRLPIPNQLIFIISYPEGGNILIVDAIGRRVIDVGQQLGSTEPRIFADVVKHDVLGTRFAVADTTTFRTALVGFDLPEPLLLAGAPIAVGPNSVATQVVSQRADVTLTSSDGTPLASATTNVIAAGSIVDEKLVAVTDDAQLIRLEPSGDAEKLDSATLPAETDVDFLVATADGERLIMIGSTLTAIAKPDGTEIVSQPRSKPTTPTQPNPSWRCLPVDLDGDTMLLWSLDSGVELGDFGAVTITDRSTDGCILTTKTDADLSVVTADPTGDDKTATLTPLEETTDAWLSPEGKSLIRRTANDTTEVANIDGDRLDPLFEIPNAPANLMAAFINHPKN